MRYIAAIVILALVIFGAGYVYMNFYYTYPVEVAAQYLDMLMERDFSSLIMFYHSEYEMPSEADLIQADRNFSDSFGLTDIEILTIKPLEESLSKAKYLVDLRYSSRYFDPLTIQFNLDLSWDKLLEWKVIWANILPLPQYGLDAEYRRVRSEPIRGNIYDRNNYLLAGQGSMVQVGVQPDRITDPELLNQVLAENLGLGPEYIQQQYLAPGVQAHWFVPLITISEEDYQRSGPVLRPVPGIFFRRETIRVYPSGASTGHITGYLGEVTTDLINQNPTREYLVGENAGRSGLELGFEDTLRGSPGYDFIVRDQDGQETTVAKRPVVNGSDVNLTLDLVLQQLAVEVLADAQGALVVINATTGEILALASTPSYDPNEFMAGMPVARWNAISRDPRQPMFNRALQGVYPPGSVFKVVTAAAALEENIYDADSPFVDSGELFVQGNIIRNYGMEVFGEHQLADGVIKSINTTIAKVGLELGSERLSEYFTRWQLDKRPDFGLPATAGQIGNLIQSQVNLVWSAVGQAQVLVTPFHIASLFTVFVNDGILPAFSLVQGHTTDEPKRVLAEETTVVMRDILEQVVNDGTGKAAAVSGLKIGGKTGTAETGRGTNHAWFGGYVLDFGEYPLAFALLVEDGGVGGVTAAPLINQYFKEALQY